MEVLRLAWVRDCTMIKAFDFSKYLRINFEGSPPEWRGWYLGALKANSYVDSKACRLKKYCTINGFNRLGSTQQAGKCSTHTVDITNGRTMKARNTVFSACHVPHAVIQYFADGTTNRMEEDLELFKWIVAREGYGHLFYMTVCTVMKLDSVIFIYVFVLIHFECCVSQNLLEVFHLFC